jgi:hypothetical protein
MQMIIGWFEIAALAGAICLALFSPGVKRRYGVVIIAMPQTGPPEAG